MFEAEKHRRTLNEVSWNNQFIWPQEFASAAKWALAEIERLTQENADLKSKLERESTEELTRKIAELAILCVDAQCEAIRLKRKVNTLLDARLNGGMLLGKDDVKKEVIE